MPRKRQLYSGALWRHRGPVLMIFQCCAKFQGRVFPRCFSLCGHPALTRSLHSHLWLCSSAALTWAAHQPSSQHTPISFYCSCRANGSLSKAVSLTRRHPLGSCRLVVWLWQALCWVAWARCGLRALCFGSALKQALPDQLQPLAEPALAGWLLIPLMSFLSFTSPQLLLSPLQ